MAADPELEALVALTRALEQSVACCEFATALQLQDELRERIDAFVHARRDDSLCAPLIEQLAAANGRVLARAEVARDSVLAALQQLARHRRVAESYAASARLG